jgi:hypothetical protein
MPLISMIIHQIRVAAEVPPVLKKTRHHMMTDRIFTAVHKIHCSMQRFKVRNIAVIEKTVVAESTSG